ncbi:hypothetical protein GSI_08410 [Ganoderma sinense ZZ0214-1]|uniref:Fungal-type protein kinase domain-containing protein n=1 Tax=Ganoderma sinense ZZ0214-1 TaxID=1077348 RepID=A0A2G8S7E3_9APHY|nr:hypothetical protein GSI_08410 [Ganoderma sinense ZZ0214-1]
MTPHPLLNQTVRIRFEDMTETYFSAVDWDAFAATYPEDSINRIHAGFQDAVNRETALRTDVRRQRKIVPEAWRAVDASETLCPGYLLNIFQNGTDLIHDKRYYQVCGALIPTSDSHLIHKDQPNHFLDDLSVVFKRGGPQNDPWNTTGVVDPDARADALDQLESHAERHFYFQHRTGLFMLFVNSAEFRVIRWDRSGCIVTEALNYVESPDHTKKLLRFLYTYSQATPDQRGIDTTATRLSRDSCGWQWMQKLAAAHANDLDYADGTVLESVPEGFVIKATRDAPASPLFSSNVLAEDPTATTGFADLSSLGDTSSMVTPVFKYVRDLFRESIPQTWTCYSLKVCGRDYLVGKPTFAPQGMVGRGTRGYVALEWKTQRFVFLKDAWRPFYHGVDPEGDTLHSLNKAHIPFVPTLVCHGDVNGGGQETHASEYSATGSKKPDVFGAQGKEDRPIAPMPSRPKASRSRSTTVTSGGPAPTIPTSDGAGVSQSSGARNSGTGGGRSGGKRARSQTKDPVQVEILEGTGLRHLTHYRIVVAEVCLPSSAFTSGKQLVKLLWNCIDAHGDAFEQCNILHRDVSAGNILILPIIDINVSKRKGQTISVMWGGLLGDWELAKKCPDGQETSRARQPHRTGTWYYMSVYSVENPGIPVWIPDELESFFHVLLYLAFRYLRTSLRSPGMFIGDYFSSSGRDDDGRTLCGALKRQVVCDGRLLFNRKPVGFLPVPQPSSESLHDGSSLLDSRPSPLNQLIQDLLNRFKAHYDVRNYDAAVQEQQRQSATERLPSLYDTMDGTTAAKDDSDSDSDSDSDDGEAQLLRMRRKYGDAQTRAGVAPEVIEVLPAAAPEIKEPSDEEKRRAASLATHVYVRDLFFSYVRPKVAWPSKDYVGDQLKGYVRPEERFKRFRGGSTVERDTEDEDGGSRLFLSQFKLNHRGRNFSSRSDEYPDAALLPERPPTCLSNGATNRCNMTPDPELDNTIRLPFEDIVDTYFPSLNSDAFDAAYSEDTIQRIHTKLQETVSRRPVDDTRHKETILSEAWVSLYLSVSLAGAMISILNGSLRPLQLDVDVVETLCPGYILNLFDARAGTTNSKRHNVYGALISKSDNHLVQQDQPNYFLDDLSLVFKRGGAQHDPWNTTGVVDPDARDDALDQLESHAERHFYFQHRTGLFMLFVNGAEFRVIRWDRSGCIVTEALNYVESPDHTKTLLRFLYAYSQATPEQRGIDITATRLDRDSCGWQWMQKLAAAHAKDLDYSDGTVLDSVPEGFVMKATGDAPTSPLFASSILTEDPTATTGFTDFSSLGDTSALMVPVFKYVRDFFRNSVPETWTCYSLKVRGRHYLVGKPIYASRHLVGRGTRGYVALEWETQRFVFLKDVWRPAHHGVDRTEGETLKILNDAHVPFVPTLVCHEDVDGGSQETQAARVSATGTKKDRPIAPLPSRPPAAPSLSAIPQEPPVQTASTSPSPQGKQPPDIIDSEPSPEGDGTGKSLKRPRSQTTAPAPEPNHKYRPNLRRLAHYRLVVAQVCLPSSAFTSGKQLVRLIWNCIDGHGCAAERCDLLHCDVSAGNVLIFPIVKVVPSKKRRRGQKIIVVWCGVLGDWELAKKCPDVRELETSSKPRQLVKQRAGTWYFMSVYAIQNPSIPISIADELESFFHVLLYLALRYLRSDLPYPGIFIDEYFASDCRDRHGKAMCGHLKQEVVRRGRLAFDLDQVTFLPDPLPCESDSESQPEDNRNLVLDASRPPSPLNHLFAVLLDHFKAHYAVRKYNAAIKARELQPPKPPVATSPPPATDSTADSNSDPNSGSQTPSEAIRRLLRMRQIWGDGKARPMPAPKITKVRYNWTPPEPQEPSDEERAKAAKLATHQYVKDWFSYIEGGVLWPKEDHVGDQLEGFVHPRYKRFCWAIATSTEDEDGDRNGEESEISDWDD